MQGLSFENLNVMNMIKYSDGISSGRIPAHVRLSGAHVLLRLYMYLSLDAPPGGSMFLLQLLDPGPPPCLLVHLLLQFTEGFSLTALLLIGSKPIQLYKT